MKSRLFSMSLIAAVVIALAAGALSDSRASRAIPVTNITNKPGSAPAPQGSRYKVTPDQSQFMVEAYSGGLLWFMGHTHHFAVRNFSGEAQANPQSLDPGSLELTVKADSLEETGKDFTEEQKKIINEGARKEVLQAANYPEIVFKSTDTKSKKTGENQFKVDIGGDLTLHGVTRRIVIPAQVTLNGDTLKATGEFSVNRSDFGVKTHSIKGGMIRVRNRVKFSFDILARRV